MDRAATHEREVESAAQPFVLPDEAVHEDFHRGLKERHIQMIAIGGAIGVGLFLGSAKAIQQAGPSLLLAYAVAGVVIFLIMRALGELMLYRPVSGSFATYADEFVGPWAGFATAWTYWLMWVVIAMAEITAAGIYVQYWVPGLPQWVPALAALVVLLGVNLIAVGVFGEFEFWFAIIKVVTIIGMILLGLAIILLGISDLSHTASFSNLWSHGGFFPKGFSGPFLALQIVMFAFLGVELIGVTAGEAQNPEKTIPSAINKVIWRILIFYVGALTIIMSLVAWNHLNPSQSPFVVVFSRVGIPTAAGIVNFVVLTAALSSCNSGIFSTGRMLYTLAGFRQAPASLRKVSRHKVPAVGMMVSFVAMLGGVVSELLHSCQRVCLHHEHRDRLWAVRVGDGHGLASAVPQSGQRQAAARGQVPNAAHAGWELVRAGLPGVGAGAAGVQPRHQDRVVRGPCVGVGDGGRIFRLARTPHPTDPSAGHGGCARLPSQSRPGLPGQLSGPLRDQRDFF